MHPALREGLSDCLSSFCRLWFVSQTAKERVAKARPGAQKQSEEESESEIVGFEKPNALWTLTYNIETKL